MEAPKCRTCGQKHWRPPCPGAGKAGIVATDGKRYLFNDGERVTESVTKGVSVTADVTASDGMHACPVCGQVHKARRYASDAERQAAYRGRRG